MFLTKEQLAFIMGHILALQKMERLVKFIDMDNQKTVVVVVLQKVRYIN